MLPAKVLQWGGGSYGTIGETVVIFVELPFTPLCSTGTAVSEPSRGCLSTSSVMTTRSQ